MLVLQNKLVLGYVVVGETKSILELNLHRNLFLKSLTRGLICEELGPKPNQKFYQIFINP